MARSQFKVTFTNAQPGAPVAILAPSMEHVYPSATAGPVGGQQLYLDATNSITVWSEAQAVIAQTVDGTGTYIQGTATTASPTITVTDGTAPTNPSGSAASSALSATKLAQVRSSLIPLTVAHGTTTTVDFTGGVIVKGAAYWGVPGSALDLDVTIIAGGTVRVPQDDRQYDIWGIVNLACDVADAGKLVGLSIQGNDLSATTWVPIRADGSAFVIASVTDQVFTGDGPSASTALVVDGEFLTVDASASAAKMLLLQR